jgi:hypothetical protein
MSKTRADDVSTQEASPLLRNCCEGSPVWSRGSGDGSALVNAERKKKRVRMLNTIILSVGSAFGTATAAKLASMVLDLKRIQELDAWTVG